MHKFLSCILLAFFLLGCAVVKTRVPEREFNFQEFTGLVSTEISVYEDAVLNYEMNKKNGEVVHFTNCLQVESIGEDTIKTSQYQWYKLIMINCKALKLYTEKGTQAKRSYFPEIMNEKLVAGWPAVVGPIINDEEMIRRQGKTLSEYETELKISIKDKNTVDVLTDYDDITYCIMARADFNSDGIEDLLVRMIWHVRDAFGKGSDLFIFEKTSHASPVSLTWRFNGIE